MVIETALAVFGIVCPVLVKDGSRGVEQTSMEVGVAHVAVAD